MQTRSTKTRAAAPSAPAPSASAPSAPPSPRWWLTIETKRDTWYWLLPESASALEFGSPSNDQSLIKTASDNLDSGNDSLARASVRLHGRHYAWRHKKDRQPRPQYPNYGSCVVTTPSSRHFIIEEKQVFFFHILATVLISFFCSFFYEIVKSYSF